MADFHDHFSTDSAAYRQYRPSYPQALFEFLGSISSRRQLAWDCATGNGQAALGLVPMFDHVLATDASFNQLRHADRKSNIHYCLARAEHPAIKPNCVDLITVAQAMHWFDHEVFFSACQKVLKSGGMIAAWCYRLFRVAPSIDAIIDDFYQHNLKNYWAPQRRHVDDAYRSIAWPWRDETAPTFKYMANWDLPTLLAYMRTWSAVKKFRETTGDDPLQALESRLAAHWPGQGAQAMTIEWEICLRLGRQD